MKLLFVYNANSGPLSALADVAHKLMSPATYPCSLCALTYDTVTENKIWKKFRSESHLTMIFFHRDEFEKVYPDANITYPVILKHDHKKLETVLNADDLNAISNVEDLIERINAVV